MDANRRSYLEDSVMGKAVTGRLPGSHYLPEGTRVYISGHTGRSLEAFEVFADAARERGWIPVNPHEVDHGHPGRCIGAEVPRPVGEPASKHKYGCYIRANLKALLECDAVLSMPGWPTSASASTERQVAQLCGLQVIEHYEIHEVEGGA